MKFIAAAVLALAFALALAGKLPINVYIEADCKFSKQLCVQQIAPAWNSIKDSVTINFFTHGKSTSYTDEEGNVVFECQHGPVECDHNKLQTCALELLSPHQDRQVAFIICTMSGQKTYEQCAVNVGLVYTDLEAMANSTRGTDLQLKMERNTKPVIEQSEHVPVICYNGTYVQELYARSLTNFSGVVHELLAA